MFYAIIKFIANILPSSDGSVTFKIQQRFVLYNAYNEAKSIQKMLQAYGLALHLDEARLIRIIFLSPMCLSPLYNTISG